MASSAPMDNDGAILPATKKRKVVDTVASGSNRAPYSPAVKKECLSLIIHLHEIVSISFPAAVINDLRQGCALTSMVWNVVTRVRQSDNGGEGKTKDLIVMLEFGETTLEGERFLDMVNLFREVMLLYGVSFAIKDNAANGTFMALLALVYRFKYAMDEVRIVNSAIKIGRDKETDKFTLGKSYGINPNHYYLLKGINYPPILAGSLASSLGPACLLVKLAECNPKYSNKWKKAAANAFNQLQSIEGVVDQIAGKGKEASELIAKLCTIADFGISKQANKVSMPYASLYHGLDAEKGDAWRKALKADMLTKLPENAKKACLNNLDFSGHGCYGIYNNLVKIEGLSYPGKLTGEQAAQCFAMAYFGIEGEDFAIIRYMFGKQELYHRTDLGLSYT